MPVSKRSNISSFKVMDVMRQAAAREAIGEQIVHMEVGQPGTAAPRTAIEAAKSALDHHDLGYTLALGLPSLRVKIAEHYRRTHRVDVDPARIVVTSGSSAGFVLSFLALFDAGQRVALPAPGYPCYRNILAGLGQTVAEIPTGPMTRWMPTVIDLEREHTREALSGLVIASPANPTGTMLLDERQEELAKFCQENRIWLVSDEIYHGLTYDHPARTALSVTDHAVVINSFSKYYAMTGWRIGWMVVPEDLVPVIERLAQNFYISPPTLSQIAAEAAFDGVEELEGKRAVYAANRACLINGLKSLGLDTFAPADGAFYLYVDVSRFADDSEAFANQMLVETNVAVTPGIDFDARGGRRFVRFCFAGTEESVTNAVERLHAWPRLKALRT